MPLDLRLELYSTLVTGKWKLKTSMASQEEPSGSCWLLDGSPSSCLELSTLGTTKCIQGRNNHIYCFIEFEVFTPLVEWTARQTIWSKRWPFTCMGPKGSCGRLTKVRNMGLYSSGRKSSIFSFVLLLLQILVNYHNQGQI